MRAIILTKAHRAAVSMMGWGVMWPEYCLRGVLIFTTHLYQYTIPIF